jgi:hypothetical protein
MRAEHKEHASMPRNLQVHDESLDYTWWVELPSPIQADWDQKWGQLLAGFPVELVYSSTSPPVENGRTPVVRKARYAFDPGSFLEDAQKKEMHYFPCLPSKHYAVVTWEKAARRWQTRKFDGDRLIAEATGATFERAMIHTLLIGLQPNESAE